MSVLSRAQSVLLATALALALPAGTASAENFTMKKFEKAMEDVFSGKIFEAAVKQVRQAHHEYVVKPAANNSTWPFYIPEQSSKPIPLGPQAGTRSSTLQAPKAKPLVADPKVRRMQAALNTLGYDAGVADGIYGRKTARAVERYQSTIGETVTGDLTTEQRDLLLTSAHKKRQLAAVQPKHGSEARAHTVVVKQIDTQINELIEAFRNATEDRRAALRTEYETDRQKLQQLHY